MSDETVAAPEAPEVVDEAAAKKAAQSAKMKAWHAANKAKKAAAGPEATEAEKCRAVPASEAGGGFLSWDEFCNRVAVDLVTSQFGFQMLTNYTGAEAAQVFHSRMALAYKAMADAHARGA